MVNVAEVVAQLSIQEEELAQWVEQKWVRPASDGDGWSFDDGDMARLALICELRRGLAVNDDAIPVVLSLLDQLYAARNTLRHVRDALAQLPDPALQDILARISEELGKE